MGIGFDYSSVTDTVDSNDTDDLVEKCFAAEKNPEVSVIMDFDTYQRDAMYEPDQYFAVFEKDDVQGLITKLTESIHTAYL